MPRNIQSDVLTILTMPIRMKFKIIVLEIIVALLILIFAVFQITIHMQGGQNHGGRDTLQKCIADVGVSLILTS